MSAEPNLCLSRPAKAISLGFVALACFFFGSAGGLCLRGSERAGGASSYQ